MAHPIPGTATTVRSFRKPLTGAIVSTVLFGAVATVLIALVLPNMLPVSMARIERAMLTLAAIVVVVLLIAFLLLWWTNYTVVVEPDTVRIRRPFVTVHTWPRQSTQFSSNVTKHTTYGLPSGSNRALVATGPDGRSASVQVGLGRKKFNELMHELDPVRSGPGLPAHAATGAPTPTNTPQTLPVRSEFTIDTGRLRSRARGLLLAGCGLIVLAGVAAVLTSSGALATVGADLGIGATLIGGLAGVCLTVLGAVLATRGRSAPRVVRVDQLAVTVDDRAFPYQDLKRIWVSPPTYPRRTLRLAPTRGGTRRYLVGDGNLVEVDGYAELLHALGERTAGYPGLVTLDRE